MSHLQPTRIVDKNGRSTTVRKRVDKNGVDTRQSRVTRLMDNSGEFYNKNGSRIQPEQPKKREKVSRLNIGSATKDIAESVKGNLKKEFPRARVVVTPEHSSIRGTSGIKVEVAYPAGEQGGVPNSIEINMRGALDGYEGLSIESAKSKTSFEPYGGSVPAIQMRNKEMAIYQQDWKFTLG